MWPYVNRMSDIVKELQQEDKGQLKSCLTYIDNMIPIGKNIAIFITEVRSNIIMRLSLMIRGKTFYVIPTTMTSSEIVSCLTEISNPIVITDNIDNIKCNSNFAQIEEYDIVSSYYLSNDISLEIEPSFKMILYSDTLQYVSTNEYNFIAVFENLISYLKKEGLLDKIPYIYNITDDFFIYYLALMYFGITPNEVNNQVGKYPKTEKDKILFITYEDYRNIWKEVLSLTLQNKLLFKWFFDRWLGRIIIYLIVRKFEKYFNPFKNIIVLGLITDPILAEISEKLRHSLVYNTYGEQNSLMFFGISKKPGHIYIVPSLSTLSVSLKDNRKKYLILSDEKKISSTETSQLVMTVGGPNFLKSITTNALFTMNGSFAKFLGHAFSNGVCPAYVESIFNSFPFIKDCALVWWKEKYILLLDVDEAMLDANRINWNFFKKIMKGQVQKVNQELLPEEIQISTFGEIPSMILRYNRWGLLDKEFLYKVEHFN